MDAAWGATGRDPRERWLKGREGSVWGASKSDVWWARWVGSRRRTLPARVPTARREETDGEASQGAH